MSNTYNKIIWSASAKRGFDNIVNYIKTDFSENDVRKFLKKFHEQLNRIKQSPNSFPFVNDSKIFKRALIAKLTSIIFSVEGENIKIYTIYDNRQNPPKID